MKKISKETIIRTVILVVTLINTLLTALGLNPLPFSENEIYQVISSVCTVAAAIWAWWKNNSFTKAAIKADEIMKQIKEAAKEEKVDSLDDKADSNKQDELK